MKKTTCFAVLSALLGALPAFAAEADCLKLSMSVKQVVAAEQSKVLEIVSSEVAAAPGCACEIVKAAIEGSNANVDTVAAIVESASIAAPEQMRLVSQCAVAVAPDALIKVQAVLAKLDPNLGESGVKSAKSAKAPAGEVAAMPNPLDFPGQGPVGPTPGGPGGTPLLVVFPPIIINPPEVTTDTNPRKQR
ncbi:MAG: hypothetical protein ABI162_19110 [Luteolibacter sp.]